MEQTTGKTAIVTGASRGIGRAIALRLAGEGYVVVVNYVRGAADAASVVREIQASGGRSIAVQADVSSSADMERLYATAAEVFGTVDVVVNNAGVSKILPLADMDDAVFDLLFHTNVRGVLHSFKCAARYMSNGGRIINFSSTAVGTATPGMGAYIGTKAAVEAMTKVFAKELRGRGITVNAIAPGLVASEMFYEGKTAEQVEQMAQLSPLGRLGTTQEIANVVSFLAGGQGSWINGQVIRVNGGVV